MMGAVRMVSQEHMECNSDGEMRQCMECNDLGIDREHMDCKGSGEGQKRIECNDDEVG